LNGAIFYYDYRDQQVQGLEYDRDNGRLGKITNVPKSSISGGELELVWAVAPGLSISQHVAYNDGQYDEYFAIDGPATDAANPPDGPWDTIIANDRSGERLGFPRLTYGGSVAYDWTVGNVDVRAETNYSYRDELYSVSASSIIPEYWLANASLGFSPVGSNWSVTVWGRNIFDEYFEETRNGFNGSARPTTSPHQPRTLGVRLDMDF
jgi:outer membrane receptor protein involved in Fe transport